MYDAFLTIDKLIEDIQNNQLDKHNVSNDLKINGKENVMDWNQWKIIDEVEKINGIQKGKVREKIEDLDRMMEIGCKKI